MVIVGIVALRDLLTEVAFAFASRVALTFCSNDAGAGGADAGLALLELEIEA